MKLVFVSARADCGSESSPAFCGGLIEATASQTRSEAASERSSPAFCGGLIEAGRAWPPCCTASPSSPAFCGGLIEAGELGGRRPAFGVSSPAFCGGLIEAGCDQPMPWERATCLPPRSAGVSLKQSNTLTGLIPFLTSSPAFCGGLIEARVERGLRHWRSQSSPAFCGGLIEAWPSSSSEANRSRVFPRVLRGSH